MSARTEERLQKETQGRVVGRIDVEEGMGWTGVLGTDVGRRPVV